MALALAAAFIPAGCASDFKLLNRRKAPLQANRENPVSNILTLWQPAEGVGLDQQIGRGFAGQIFFMTMKEQLPAQVDGTVRVYLFDDQGTPEEQGKPIHQFDFPAEAWKMQLQNTQLGPAYAVFIPYVRKGYHQAQCSLRLRFTPVDGPIVYSDLIKVHLTGGKSLPSPTREKTAAAGSSGSLAAQRPAALSGGSSQLTYPPQTQTPLSNRAEARHVENPADPEGSPWKTSVSYQGTDSPDEEGSPSVGLLSQPASAPVPLTPAERRRIIAEARALVEEEALPGLNGPILPAQRTGLRTQTVPMYGGTGTQPIR